MAEKKSDDKPVCDGCLSPTRKPCHRVYCPNRKTVTADVPDGSAVHLNSVGCSHKIPIRYDD